MRKRESGFGVVEIILVVVVVGLLGVMGWLVWQRSQTPSTTTQTTTTPAETATDSPAIVDPQTFRITEWNVTAKNTSTYALQYKITSDNRYADFTAKELIDATGACPVENAPSGRIARYAANEVATGPGMTQMTATERAQQYESDPELKDRYKKVGDYYYFFIAPQGACSEKEIPLQDNVTMAVHDLLRTFGQ